MNRGRPRHVLVTGGAGFIGSHLAEGYLRAGWRVTVADSLVRGKRENVPPGADFVEVDIRSPEFERLVREERFDVVSHHAAQIDVRASVADPRLDAGVNVDGLLNVLEAARAGGVRRVLFASSGGTVYGEPESLPVAEHAPKCPENPYGVGKLAGEHYLLCYHRVHGLDYVALRYGNVYGQRQDPHGEAGVVAIFSTRLALGEPLTVYGDGHQTRDYVSVHDVVAANLLVTDAELPPGRRLDDRAFNVGSGRGASVHEVVGALGAAACVRPRVHRAPPRAGEMRHCALECGKLQALGWRPRTPLAPGVGSVYRWMRARLVEAEPAAAALPPAAPVRPRARSLPRSPELPELPWVRVAEGAPYFATERGEPWTPVGDNTAVTWPELAPLFRRRDLAAVDRHLAGLAAHGVTVLRLMLECAHQRRYLERPIGRFVPGMVRVWDDLLGLCARHGLRVMLTPYDTFWTWIHWAGHPLNRARGGPCAHPWQFLTDRATREAVLARLEFAAERWGGSGVIFSWDLWNEIHPSHAGDRADCADIMADFTAEVGGRLRETELRLWGRAHPQTVSLYGPELHWQPHLRLEAPVFRHPALEFASTHVYMEGTIDHPRDTVAPALDMGRLVREALAEIRDGRPYLDTEHGPIHTFKDHEITLPEPFDDEYFRHLQWAHLAAGGAGGGMRWPNRDPHQLTAGMRRAQLALSRFLPLVDWLSFRRRNLGGEVEVRAEGGAVAACACGDTRQAVLWLVRTDTIGPDGMLRRDAAPVRTRVRVPGLADGLYRATAWDTVRGVEVASVEGMAEGGRGAGFELPPLAADMAVAVRAVA